MGQLHRIRGLPLRDAHDQDLVFGACTLPGFHPDRRRLLDARVVGDLPLNLHRRHVLTTTADVVLDAVHEVQVPVGIHPPQVTGVQLEVPEVLRRLLRHPVIRPHHDVRDLHVHNDLTRRIRRQRPVRTRLHDDALVPGVGLTDRTRHRRPGRIHIGRHARLGEPIAFDERDAEPVLELVVDVLGRRRRKHRVDLVGTVQVRFGDVVDEVADRPDRVEDRCLRVDHLLPETTRGESLDERDPATGDKRGIRRQHLGVGMKQRQTREKGVLRQRLHRLFGGRGDDLKQPARREVVGGVLLNHTLRATRRTRREHDPRIRRPRILNPRLRIRRRHQCRKRLTFDAWRRATSPGLQHDHVLKQRQLPRHNLQALKKRIMDEKLFGLDEVNRPRKEITLIRGVDRAHHRPRLKDPEPHGQELLTIRKHYRHRLTRLNPPGNQRVRDPVRIRVDLAIRHPRPITKPQQIPIRRRRRPLSQNIREHPLRRVLARVPITPLSGHEKDPWIGVVDRWIRAPCPG